MLNIKFAPYRLYGAKVFEQRASLKYFWLIDLLNNKSTWQNKKITKLQIQLTGCIFLPAGKSRN